MPPKTVSKFKWERLALGLSIVLAIGGANPSLAQTKGHPATAPLPPSVPNQILVMAHSGADKDECSEALRGVDGKILKTMTNGRLTVYLVEVPKGQQQETIKKLSKDTAHFDSVQVNALAKRNFTANDPLFPQQYGLTQMNVPAAWNLKGDGKGVTIGFIDTGIVQGQPDLAGRIDHGFNVITGGNGDSDPSTGFQHGTFVATCAAASTANFLLGASAAYRSFLIPVDVFNGAATVSDADVLAGLFYLESRGVRLINLSVNADVPFTFANKSVHPALFAGFVDFYNGGGLLFNAAGNDGMFDNSPRTHNLIVISAINSAEKLASFSTRGNPLWFCAAGKNVVSSGAGGVALVGDGTSFATPLALSVAAQIWAQNPGLSNAQVLQIMQNTATKPPNFSQTKFGFGIPNAGAALLSH
jgi:thermitase